MIQSEGWHWAYCPRCGGSGTTEERMTILGGTASTTPMQSWTQKRTCAVCEGGGKLRIPDGYSLRPDPIPHVVITSGTNILFRDDDGHS